MASNRVAMAFLLEHRATGRLAHTDTVYGKDLAKAARLVAYQVAARRFRRTTDRSTRANPSWYHSAKGLRMYDEALYFARGRRVDEAIDSATWGLAEDPPNLSLRRLLGETYERLDYHLDAVAVYASGLVLVRDDRNSWLRRAPAPTARRRGRMRPRPTGPREWPQTRHRRSRSREVSGVLWRFLQVFSAGDQWIDRWTDDLIYAEHLVRERELAAVGAAPAARPLPSTNDPGKDWLDPDQFPLRHTERQHDLDRRHRQAGMIRAVLQDPDSHESNEIDVQIEGARQPAQSADGAPAPLPTGWEERNDEFCWDAIHALAQVILVHRPGEVNALDAGTLDWILHEFSPSSPASPGR